MTFATIVLAVAGFFLAAFWTERHRLRRLRSQHRRTHRPMSDAEFTQTIGITPEQGGAAVRVRQALAAAMGVPVETLHPGDDLEYISTFGFDNMDLVELVVAIENVLQTRICNKDMGHFMSTSQKPNLASLVQFLSARGFLTKP